MIDLKKLIFNKENLFMLILLIIGLVFYTIGSINGFKEICNHYNTEPNYETLFTTKECKQNIKPLSCLLPVADVSECYGFKETYQN